MKLDTYSLKARVYPSVLVLFPIFLIGIYYVTNIEAYYHYFTSFAFLGLFFIFKGEVRGEIGIVFKKAIHICLECIGIG